MKKYKLIQYLSAISLLVSMPVYAQDKDDELKAEDVQHVEAEDGSESAEVERQNPEAAAEIRAFISLHLEHANSKDLDAYMKDFLKSGQRRPDLQREYAERAMALKELRMEVVSIEFAKIQRRGATIHTRQISSYINDSGVRVVDDVILSYRLQRDEEGAWKIAFTERRRLSA